jgi:hypothetical protein
MERSEALKGLRWIRPSGRFILYDHVWEPTGVMLGEDVYPSQASVLYALSEASSDVLVLSPDERPSFHGRPVAANVFTLGAMFTTPILKDLIDPGIIETILIQRWPKASEANRAAFCAGMAMGNLPDDTLPGGSRPEGPTE